MTRGEKILPALITEIGKRADLVSMLHLHHSPDFAPHPRGSGRQDSDGRGLRAGDGNRRTGRAEGRQCQRT
jgi:hypothetical protein